VRGLGIKDWAEAIEVLNVQTRQLRFDIGLLAKRLVGATDWLTQQPAVNQLPIGYFGASTGAAAAWHSSHSAR
jgi:hypothetical protein